MKLEKAIEILEDELVEYLLGDRPEFVDAVKLGIEALKRHREDRLLNVWTFPRSLPGETEERTVQREGKDIIGGYSYEERRK